MALRLSLSISSLSLSSLRKFVTGAGDPGAPGDPTFSLARSAAAVNEGQSFTITLTTENVDAGTSVAFTITGVASADIGGASTTGNFVVGTTDSFTFNVTADSSTEGTETFALALDNGEANIAVTINDTSTSTALSDIFGLLLQNGTELLLTEESEFILRQLVDKNIIITQDNKELILQDGFNLLLEQQDYMLAQKDDNDTRTHITTQAGGNLRLG